MKKDKMKAEIRIKEIGNFDFEIKGKLVKESIPFPNTEEKYEGMHNKYKITVKNKDGNKISFDFYDSESNLSRQELPELALKLAFRSFLEDARSGYLDFDEFCSEYGYDSDSNRALAIFKLCEKASKKAQDLDLNECDIDNLLNELSERGIE
jgi:hypothetical protein